MNQTKVSQEVEELPAAVRQLVRLLGPRYLALLVQALEGVRETTGYGAVEIIIAERTVQTIKEVKSYK